MNLLNVPIIVQPKTDRGAFLKFIEKSGLAAVIQESLEALQAARDRPDDPIHWIRNYLRTKAPRRTAELNGIMESLQNEIIDLETEVIVAKLTKIDGIVLAILYQILQLYNSKVFREIQEETKAMRSSLWYPQKLINQFPVDKAYVEGGGDEIWQVKPDPGFKPSGPLDLAPPEPVEDGDEANAQFLGALITPPPASRASMTRHTPRASVEESVEGWGEPESPLCKSTETSPQRSLENVLKVEPEV